MIILSNKKGNNDEELMQLIQTKNWNKYKFLFLKINNKNKKKFFLFICIFIFAISYYLYYLSLEKCLDGFDECGIKNDWILTKLIEAILSSIILSFLIEGMIFKIISKFHFFHILIVYTFLFIYSHGIDFHDHGFFNFIGCLTISLIILLIITPINILLYLLSLI